MIINESYFDDLEIKDEDVVVDDELNTELTPDDVCNMFS
jgi:hypothetical protein